MAVVSFQPMIESRPLREIVYEVIKHAIITGEIPAGRHIVETEVAESMHISRTPLREALRELEKDGLLEYVPRRGMLVRAFTLADVEEIYTIRNALEMATLPAIIRNATAEDVAELYRKLREMDGVMAQRQFETLSPMARDFHHHLTGLCRQNRLLRAIEAQDEFITRFSAMAIRQEDRLTAAHEEHYQLVKYVEQKDLTGLSELMGRHIDRSKENCLVALKALRAGMNLSETPSDTEAEKEG